MAQRCVVVALVGLALATLAATAATPETAAAPKPDIEHTDIDGRFVLKKLPNLPVLPRISDIRVVLVGGFATKRVSAIVRPDGTFTLRNVVPGVYTLETHSALFEVDSERFELRKDGKVKCYWWQESRQRLQITLDTPAEYFQVRVPYDYTSLFKSPMIIMMGVSVLMMFVLPKLMANMDPEELKQMQGNTGIINSDGRVVDRDELVPTWCPPPTGSLRQRL
eukprot:m51a1_g5578 hypothetical protein (222) ;mRNA; r:624257-625127